MLSPSVTSTSFSPCTITISLKITSGKERRIFVRARLVFDGVVVAISPVGPDGRAKLAEVGAVTWLIGAMLVGAMKGTAGGIAIAFIITRGNIGLKFC